MAPNCLNLVILIACILCMLILVRGQVSPAIDTNEDMEAQSTFVKQHYYGGVPYGYAGYGYRPYGYRPYGYRPFGWGPWR